MHTLKISQVCLLGIPSVLHAARLPATRSSWMPVGCKDVVSTTWRPRDDVLYPDLSLEWCSIALSGSSTAAHPYKQHLTCSPQPLRACTTATLTRGANSSPRERTITMRATAAATLLLLRANATNTEIEWKAWGGQNVPRRHVSEPTALARSRCRQVSIIDREPGGTGLCLSKRVRGAHVLAGLVGTRTASSTTGWTARATSPGATGSRSGVRRVITGDQECSHDRPRLRPDGGPDGRVRTPGRLGRLPAGHWLLEGRTDRIVCERAEGSSDALFVAGPSGAGPTTRRLLLAWRIDRHHP